MTVNGNETLEKARDGLPLIAKSKIAGMVANVEKPYRIKCCAPGNIYIFGNTERRRGIWQSNRMGNI